MPHLNQIAARVLNRPLLLEASYAQVFIASIADRLNVVQLTTADGKIIEGNGLVDLASSFSSSRGEQQKPYQVVNNIAVIPIAGTLVHKHGYMKPYSGMTGYDGIIARIQVAIADPQVKGLLLDMNTPGGEVAGCFDCSDFIAEMRNIKPIWSFCNEMNASAGQAIASACSHRLITQTAVAGSIGVIRGHTSYEKHLEKEGIKVTLITSGKHKADGNPYQDLPADVLARFETDTADLREMFAAKVAGYTGLTIEAVKQTEALCYTGQAAIDIGLADRLVRSDKALTIFSQYLATRQNFNHTAIGASMPNPNNEAETIDQATHASLVTQASADAAAQAKTAERDRIGAIMGCAEAAGRETQASYIAYKTDMNLADAQAMLAAAPIATMEITAEIDPLGAAMGLVPQPGVSADNAESEGSAASHIDLNAALAKVMG